MAAWLKEELRKIAGEDDLHVAPTWIWSVAAGGQTLGC